MTRKEAYDQAIARAHASPLDHRSLQLAELSALAELGLGHPLSDEKLHALAEIQTHLRSQQASLAAQLEGEKLSPDQYLTELTRALDEFREGGVALLGESRFNAMFGEAAEHPGGLVERETFLAQPRGWATT